MNIKFFRANRGEGKTKWLCEMAADESDRGKHLYYIGSHATMKGLIDRWRVNYHTKCPIVNIDEANEIERPCCFLTDGMMANLHDVDYWLAFAKINDGDWFITMDKENFLN